MNNEAIVMEIVDDFLESISLYKEEIQEEIAASIYFLVKTKRKPVKKESKKEVI